MSGRLDLHGLLHHRRDFVGEFWRPLYVVSDHFDAGPAAPIVAPEAPLDGSGDPDPVTALEVGSVVSGIPQHRRNDVDATPRFFRTGGHEVTDERAPAFEDPDFGCRGQSAGEYDEIEVHDGLLSAGDVRVSYVTTRR